MIDTTTGPTNSATNQQEPTNTLYGLDIEFLRDLNLDELIEEKKKEQET